MADIKMSRTTPSHPMGNGIAERYNSALLNMLGTLDPKGRWTGKAKLDPLFTPTIVRVKTVLGLRHTF